MIKKISHCNIDDIMTSIEENKPLNFDKKEKSKKITNSSEGSSQIINSEV